MQADAGETSGLHSLPSVPSGNVDQIRQVSTPSGSSLTGGSEKIFTVAPLGVSIPALAQLLAITDLLFLIVIHTVLTTAVPLTDQPIYTRSISGTS